MAAPLTLANVSWQEAATDPMDGYEVPFALYGGCKLYRNGEL